jgi:uncharacterized protein YecE (DUF72 family)
MARPAARIGADGWLSEGRKLHVYFDNGTEGAAPYDALLLMELAGITAQEVDGQ